jgi:hypothetical protein
MGYAGWEEIRNDYSSYSHVAKAPPRGQIRFFHGEIAADERNENGGGKRNHGPKKQTNPLLFLGFRSFNRRQGVRGKRNEWVGIERVNIVGARG